MLHAYDVFFFLNTNRTNFTNLASRCALAAVRMGDGYKRSVYINSVISLNSC